MAQENKNRDPKTQELLRELVTQYVSAGARLKQMGFVVTDFNIRTKTAQIVTPDMKIEEIALSC